MSKISRFHAALPLLLAGVSALAQEPTSCPSGPGAAFGISSYQCANCGFNQGKGGRPIYSFYAEPVILQTSGAGGAHVGDIIEAVNGKPITTFVGADFFTYPASGPSEMTVRRGRDRHLLKFVIPASAECPRPMRVPSNLGPNSVVTVDRSGPAPIIRVDGAIVELPGFAEAGQIREAPTGWYGFAVACAPSCTAEQGQEGKTRFTYYQYDGYPPIIAVKLGSPADRAGLRVGDVITKVDGHSVLEHEGSQRLGSVFSKETLHLTILRDGKEATYLVKAP